MSPVYFIQCYAIVFICQTVNYIKMEAEYILKKNANLFQEPPFDEMYFKDTQAIISCMKEYHQVNSCIDKSDLLVSFLLYLSDKKLINNHSFDFEKETKKFLSKR